jgi:tight adherence protein C
MLAGAVITVLPTVIFGRASAAPMLGVVGALIGWGAVEHRSRSARRKAEREIDEQLPVIIEMLALAVSAGEAPGSALARICAEGDGMLVRTLRGAVSDLALGSTLVQALERVRRQLPMAAIDRLIDGISIGHERGTSLTDLLHAQAQDARERQRRGLIEQAAKNEVTMMIPVVFLIMPVTVLFALFPSFHQMTWSS